MHLPNIVRMRLTTCRWLANCAPASTPPAASGHCGISIAWPGRTNYSCATALPSCLIQERPFLEFSTLAANDAYGGEAPGAGQVSGIGIVAGHEVVLHADDASVKGGAWYPLSVKKIVRALDIAIENRLPVVHLCDSAGGFLPLQAQLFPDRMHAGRIFRNQSILSRMGVPQLAVVLGHCTAGGRLYPGPLGL